MKLVKSLLMASVGLTILGSHVSAADYFVQPLTPGPVANTAIAAISLQATALDDESAPSAEQDADTQPAVLPPAGETEEEKEAAADPATTESSTTSAGTSSGAKWVSARTTSTEASSTTTAAPTTSSTTTVTAPTTTTTTASTTQATSTTSTTTLTASATTPTTTTTTTTTTSSSLSGPTPVVSAGQTYKSLGALFQTGKVTGGDRIFLRGGYHGPMVINGQRFASKVMITSMPGEIAHVDSIIVRDASNIIIDSLKVWPISNANGLTTEVRTYPNTSDLVLSDLDVRSVSTATNYRQWTITDWTNYKRSAFLVDGSRQTVTRNRVTGIFGGIFTLGPNSLIEDNIVDGFAGDAYRALGDNTVVRGNKAQNCHQTTGTHIDGFQSFSRGPTGQVGAGVVKNLLIENNKIFEAVGTPSPFNCKLQGISMFDGMYDGFVIRNNVVSSSAYHGITMAGGLNSKIVNNTVIHSKGQSGRWPWIRLSPHKNGTPPQNVTVANNLVSALKVYADATRNIVETNNVTVTNTASEFLSVAKQDFTLQPTAKAIDKGTPTLAPTTDIAKSPRPKGKAPDAGAYESY